MLFSVSPNWLSFSTSTQTTLQASGQGFLSYQNIQCEIGYQITATAVVHSDNSLSCVITTSANVQLSSRDHFFRIHDLNENVYSNGLSFFDAAPVHIDSVTVVIPARGPTKLSITGSNFKAIGAWCDFGSSVTRPTLRGGVLSCPVPRGMSQGTVRIFQDGQSSNEVSWIIL